MTVLVFVENWLGLNVLRIGQSGKFKKQRS